MRIASAFLQTFAVQLIQTIASLVTGILIARGLGPSGQGHFAFFAAVVAFGVIIASFGQYEGNVLLSAGQTSAGRTLLARAILHAGVVIALLWGLLPVARGIFMRQGALELLFLFPLIMGLEVLALLVRGINLGQHHITAYNTASLLQRLTNLIVILVIAASVGWDLHNVLWAWVAAVAISVIVSSAWIWMRSEAVRVDLSTIVTGWGLSLRRGARALVTIMVTVLLVRCDIWMLGPFLGSATVGQMSVASTLAEWLWYVPSILASVLFAATAADPVRAAPQIARAGRSMTALVLPAAILLILIGRFLVPVMYGVAYSQAGVLFVILVPGMAAISIHLVVDSYFAGRGFPAISVLAASGALLAKIGLNLLAIPLWGAAGAAGVTTLVYGGLLGVKVIAFCRETQTPAKQLLVPNGEDFRGNARLAKAWLVAKLNQRSA